MFNSTTNQNKQQQTNIHLRHNETLQTWINTRYLNINHNNTPIHKRKHVFRITHTTQMIHINKHNNKHTITTQLLKLHSKQQTQFHTKIIALTETKYTHKLANLQSQTRQYIYIYISNTQHTQPNNTQTQFQTHWPNTWIIIIIMCYSFMCCQHNNQTHNMCNQPHNTYTTTTHMDATYTQTSFQYPT